MPVNHSLQLLFLNARIMTTISVRQIVKRIGRQIIMIMMSLTTVALAGPAPVLHP